MVTCENHVERNSQVLLVLSFTLYFHPEGATTPRRFFYPSPPPAVASDFVYNGQAYACPFDFPCVCPSIENFKDMLALQLWNARAVITNKKADFISALFPSDFNRVTTLASVADSIAD